MLVAGGWSGHNIRTAEVKKDHSQKFHTLQELAKLKVSKGFSKVSKVSQTSRTWKTQVFNPATERWRVVGDLTSPRRGLTLAVLAVSVS